MEFLRHQKLQRNAGKDQRSDHYLCVFIKPTFNGTLLLDHVILFS